MSENHELLCKINEIKHSLRQYEEDLKSGLGVSLNEGLCLCAINSGFKEPSTIAEKLQLSSSRLTRVLTAMQEKKLIKRQIGKVDKRNITVSLTAIGKRKLKKIESGDVKFKLPDGAEDFI